MALSFSKDFDEQILAKLRELRGLGVEVALETSEDYPRNREVQRYATVRWQTHNPNARAL